MNTTFTRWLTCSVWAAGAVVFAQEPAARLLPARAIDPPAPTVARAAPPAAYTFQSPTSVPAPGVAARPQPQPKPQPQPQPPTLPPQPPGQASLWGGVKSVFSPKPGEPAPTEGKPWWPTPEGAPATRPNSAPAQPPAVYAGPPAYRWYGYGTPAAGSNPYAPTGRYPQASDTWFTQTGATPGAFPVPVNGQRPVPRESPTVVHAYPQEPPRPADTRRVGYQLPTHTETPPERTRVVVAESPRPGERSELTLPPGAGETVAVENGTRDVSWQPASAGSRVPIATTPSAVQPPAAEPPSPLKPSPAPAEPSTDWGPSKRAVPTDAPLPTVTITRGQAPPTPPSSADVDTAISSACYGRAIRVGVSRPGPQRLHVKLVVPSEADARDAAAVVSRLPEVKDYTVTFEAVIGK
ncbi:MAG: hypothetical protein MUF18_17280 [Fimbriiglobus sp.]|nr:hypothetical protein [Fimbriiglobus sp.]